MKQDERSLAELCALSEEEVARIEKAVFFNDPSLSYDGSTCTSSSTASAGSLTLNDLRAAISELEKHRVIDLLTPGWHGGLRVLELPDFYERRLTWRQRLTSWPWKPWVKTRREPALLESGQCILMPFAGNAFMRKSDAEALRRTIAAAGL